MDTKELGRAAREAVLGPAYFRHRRMLSASKHWSRSDIVSFQDERIAKATARYGTSIQSREHYIRHPARHLRWKLPGLLRPVTTSGTTGQPMLFWQDRLFTRQKERAYIFDIWSDAGYKPFDTRVVFRGRLGRRAIEYSAFENAYYLSPSHLTAQTRRAALEELSRVGPFFLHAYPSSLRTLNQVLGLEEMLRLPIRGILLGSEAVLPGQLEHIREVMRLPVSYWYGHSEYAVLAAFRPNTDSYHFYPTYGAVEFARDASGETSRLLATSYNAAGTQFVRYDTGDLTIGGSLPPAGDDQFIRVANIVGRVQDLVVDRDGYRKPLTAFFFGIHDKRWFSVEDVQFSQSKPGEIVAKVVLKDKASEHAVEQILRDRFLGFDVKLQWVKHIDKTASGKHRYFIGMQNPTPPNFET